MKLLGYFLKFHSFAAREVTFVVHEFAHGGEGHGLPFRTGTKKRTAPEIVNMWSGPLSFQTEDRARTYEGSPAAWDLQPT